MILGANHWTFDDDPDRTGDLNRAVRALMEEHTAELLHSARDNRVAELLASRKEIDREVRALGFNPDTGDPLDAEQAASIDVDALPSAPKQLPA